MNHRELVEVVGYTIGAGLAWLLIGALGATFVTFVIGLFIDFSFTFGNVTKVWLALACLGFISAYIRTD